MTTATRGDPFNGQRIFFRLLPERRAQAPTGPGEVAAHRDRGDPERTGDLPRFETLDLPQDEDRPLPLAQGLKGPLQRLPQLRLTRPLGGTGARVLVLHALGPGGLTPCHAAAAATVIVRGVDGDAVDPGTELLTGAEAPEVLEDADEDLLGHVFSILRRYSQEAQDAQHASLMPVQQLFERADLTVASRLDQFALGPVPCVT